MTTQSRTRARAALVAPVAFLLTLAASTSALAVVVRTAVAYRPVARPVVRAAAVVGTAAVVGSVVSTLPPACHSVIVGGVAYQECGTSWYRPYYSGTTINYTVVNPPPR